MDPKTGKTFSYIMLGIYTTVTGACIVVSDYNHAQMFAAGSLIWVASIFVWMHTKKE